jgi:hypothetical protein
MKKRSPFPEKRSPFWAKCSPFSAAYNSVVTRKSYPFIGFNCPIHRIACHTLTAVKEQLCESLVKPPWNVRDAHPRPQTIII